VKALTWFGLLAAPAAWALLLVSGYAIEEAACATNSSPVLDTDAAVPLTRGIGLAASAVAAAALVAALVSWLAHRRNGPTDPRGRHEFTAGAAVISSVVFLAVTVMTAIAVLPFDACHPA
jgi:peptidoglycan biosynthesis protein MviN/MurJ (putative lipid II flippase)